MDYIPHFFKPYELVPKATYDLLKDKPWRIWQLFDPRALYAGDRIRKRYGKMIANTWWSPALVETYGYHQFRGWRPPDCQIGSPWSQHRFGRALDLVPTEVDVEEIREDIKVGSFQYITCIEEDVDWLHFDTRNYRGLLIVRP